MRFLLIEPDRASRLIFSPPSDMRKQLQGKPIASTA
jgi:hypothetical protein